MDNLTPAADVTIIVTCYNHQAYVEQCLDSVLAQTRPPKHVIIVDDASLDDSAAVIRHWLGKNRADYTFVDHAANIGVCATMNEALTLVETTHYLQISADDWLAPERVKIQAATAAAAPDAGFVAGDFLEVDARGVGLAMHDVGERLAGMTGPDARDAFFHKLLEANIVPAPAVLIRTAAAREAGGYDESLSFEDYDLWLRLLRRHPVAHSAGLVAYYRVLPSSMSRSPERLRAFRESEMSTLRKQLGVSASADATIARRIRELTSTLRKEVAAAHRAGSAARPRGLRRLLPLQRRSSTAP